MDQQVDERHSSIQNIRQVNWKVKWALVANKYFQLAERNIFDQGYGRDFMHNGRGRNGTLLGFIFLFEINFDYYHFQIIWSCKSYTYYVILKSFFLNNICLNFR